MGKLSIVKLSENEVNLLSTALENITVKGRDCIVVAKTIEKLDRASEKFQPEIEGLTPIDMPTNGAQMSKAK
jgi:hypothetical protein